MTNETENITISKTALKEMMCDFAKEGQVQICV